MRIGELRKKDLKTVIDFAITGMHFDAYLRSGFLRRAYGRWFWYTESARATQAIAAFEGDELVGVLLAQMYDEKPQGAPWWRRAYVGLVDGIQRVFFEGSAGAYNDVNRKMIAEVRGRCDFDGEIVFLAANPELQGKGVGTQLLDELANRERGRRVFLYTDDLCTYQFYERRGFERACERRSELEMPGRKVPLLCLLYTKVL